MVVEPNHQEWQKLMKGEVERGKLCLDHKKKLNCRVCSNRVADVYVFGLAGNHGPSHTSGNNGRVYDSAIWGRSVPIVRSH